MTSETSVRLTPQEALACGMVLMASADGRGITDAELHRMLRLVEELPVFAGFGPRQVQETTEVVLNLLARPDGLDRAFEVIREVLPPRLRETAYLVACEVAAADGDANQDELRMLQDFRETLDLDRLIAGAIERAARARYQVV